MKIISITFISLLMLVSCGETKSNMVQAPKTETNTVDIGNKTITTITGSYVQPIR